MRMKMNEEIEDFEKIVQFESNQFAIVDGNVAKALKDSNIPNSDKIVYIPTKLSPGDKHSFKIIAKFDDASLKKLIIVPANAVESPPDIETLNQMKEGVRDPDIAHGESDPVLKKLSVIERKAGGDTPKTGDRAYRNKGDSAAGNPKTKLTPGVSVKARVAERASNKGAQRDNYGQPQSRATTLRASKEKKQDPISEFLQKVKNGNVTEEFLDNLKHKDQIHSSLVKLRSLTSSGHRDYKGFDVIHSSITVLEEDRKKHAVDRIKEVQDMVDRATQIGLYNLIEENKNVRRR